MVIQHSYHQGEGSDVAGGLDVKSKEKGVTFPGQMSTWLLLRTSYEIISSFLGLITTDSDSIGLGVKLQYLHFK